MTLPREGWARVLGVDPGLAATGYGIVEGDGTSARIVATGVIRTKARASKAERLTRIFEELGALIEEHRPATLAVEQQFVAENVRSAMVIGEARAVAIVAAGSRGLPVHEFTPTAVKESVAGYGGAPKEQVRQMVAVHLGVTLEELPGALDASDALAIALTRLADLRLEAALARRA
ncbi:MAG: crossover junction endodeoxyribonuclease RuvC [Dehalococcoidia bacterium]|nr:crossover junction endodeoxyribonuclease RuvC [Dehalococcoidia bacterium]